jgi:hypothetical protein
LAVTLVLVNGSPAWACSGGPDEVKPVAVGPDFGPASTGAATGLRLVGHVGIPHGNQEVNSDLWKLGDTVVVGYRCGGDGSTVIDVSDPARPRIVARTSPMPATFANDVKAIQMDTPYFSGPLFIEPHDNCATSTLPARTRLWDLSDPADPKLLGQLETVNGVHNAYPFQRDGKVYLLLALPRGDTATEGVQAGFAIADISNPRAAKVVGQYNLRADLGDVPGTDFLHDAWASADGRTAYAAWWDAGLVVLDITDVKRPRRAGRLAYYDQPEWYGPASGNTHTAVPLADGRHVVITDEDFSVGEFHFGVTAPQSEDRNYDTSLDEFLRPLIGADRVGAIEAPLGYVADGCAGRPEGLRDRVALMDRGSRCDPADLVTAAQAAGAVAVVFINPDRDGEGRLEGWRPELEIPAVQLSRTAGGRLKALVEAGTEVRVRFEGRADAWGFTRVADLGAAGGPRLVAEITTPNTYRFPPPDAGWYSVHNPMVQGDTLYLSHYADGIRQWDISDPAAPFETGFFVPPDLPDATGRPVKSHIWGVFPDGPLIYASDIAHGLWIVTPDDSITVPSPPPAPTAEPPSATPTSTPEPTQTEAPPPTWLPPPVVVSPSPTPTATDEPTSTPAPSATPEPAPTASLTPVRPDTAHLYVPLVFKPRRSVR